MKSDATTVTLYACHTAEGLARACHENAEHWWGGGVQWECISNARWHTSETGGAERSKLKIGRP